jgi:hypothetical protein
MTLKKDSNNQNPSPLTKEFLLARKNCCLSGCQNCPYPKVVSLVPSWTETLLECGLRVTARSRYCIYPEKTVSKIPIVGGTKNVNWDSIFQQPYSHILLDKEENPKNFAEVDSQHTISTHVVNIDSLITELYRLADIFDNTKLFEVAREWTLLQKQTFVVTPEGLQKGQFPGFIKWGRKPNHSIKTIVYLIWKKPWMTIGEGTFIASILKHFGFYPYVLNQLSQSERYPVIDPKQYDSKSTLFLLSTEPFPFADQLKMLKDEIEQPFALVNGELFSWFGLRSLRLLQDFINQQRQNN